MSDNFIPFNQSTPIQDRWQWKDQGQRNRNNRFQNNQRRSGGHNYSNRWGNHSNRSSYSDRSNSSFSDKNNIDAYLHPSMLQDPWAELRQKMEEKSNT